MSFYKFKFKELLSFCGLILLLLYFLMIYFNIIIVNDWHRIYFPILVVVLLSYLHVKNDRFIMKMGANSVVLIYTIFSLLSLLVLLPIFPSIQNIRSSNTMKFLQYKELIPAISISCIGIIVFVIFTSLFSRKANKDNSIAKSIFGNGIKDMNDRNEPIADYVCKFSIFIMLLCLGYFTIFIISNLTFVTQGYGNRVFQTNGNAVYGYMIVVMALSFVMFITTCNKKNIYKGLFVFGLLCILHFMLGNRGEVFYPVLAGIAIYTKRGGTFNKKFVIMGIILSLILISFIRIIRVDGLSIRNISNTFTNFSIIEGIAESFGEMGFQISTITYMLRYLNNGGNLQHGYTIIYSFQNVLSKYIPMIPIPNINSPAAIKTIMPTDYFAFTNVGEAYFNFGIMGVIAFSIILSWYLVKNSKFTGTLFSELLNNMILVEIILWVRNSSATMPAYIFIAVALLVISYFVALPRKKIL